MSKKAVKIAEWIVIGLFITIVASVASILTYRSVVNSDWYTEKQARNGLEQAIEDVNDTENIKYIKVDDNVEEHFIYDAPAELFDDLTIISFENIRDIEKMHEIWRKPCVTVFFNDGTPVSFNITDDGKVYWETFELQCPSLVDWYNEVINEKK
ncbi:MAG: hypothetical protein IJ011_01385 [Clostridia bacterium]|nr:hypothetical protein [Clostridia bacterium]